MFQPVPQLSRSATPHPVNIAQPHAVDFVASAPIDSRVRSVTSLNNAHQSNARPCDDPSREPDLREADLRDNSPPQANLLFWPDEREEVGLAEGSLYLARGVYWTQFDGVAYTCDVDDTRRVWVTKKDGTSLCIAELPPPAKPKVKLEDDAEDATCPEYVPSAANLELQNSDFALQTTVR